eukprot:352526-Chlamydomonas_euryale.AAC.7
MGGAAAACSAAMHGAATRALHAPYEGAMWGAVDRCSRRRSGGIGSAGAQVLSSALGGISGGGAEGAGAGGVVQPPAPSGGRASSKTRKGGKMRLDDLVLSLHPSYSKRMVQSWILQGGGALMHVRECVV